VCVCVYVCVCVCVCVCVYAAFLFVISVCSFWMCACINCFVSAHVFVSKCAY